MDRSVEHVYGGVISNNDIAERVYGSDVNDAELRLWLLMPSRTFIFEKKTNPS